MKTIFGILSLFLLVGCVNMPRHVESRMLTVGGDYDSVRPEMPKSEIITLLGPEQRKSDDDYIWETRYNDGNYESLTVVFDSDDRADEVRRESGRMTEKRFGLYTGDDPIARPRGRR